MTPFRHLRCLTCVEVIPEPEIVEGGRLFLGARWEQAGQEGWAPVLLGGLSGGCWFDLQSGREPRWASDAVTVVLPSREGIGLCGWLRAPRLAAVTLVVVGAGLSIRLLRHPAGRGGVGGAVTMRHLAGASPALALRGRAVSSPVHRGVETLPWQRAGTLRASVQRRPGAAEQTGRASWSGISSGRMRSRPAPLVRPVDGAPAVDDAPGADGAPAPAGAGVPSRASGGRAPCLPGTLGC